MIFTAVGLLVGSEALGRPSLFWAGSGRAGLRRSSSQCWCSRRAGCRTMV
jgi:hypothetical protein